MRLLVAIAQPAHKHVGRRLAVPQNGQHQLVGGPGGAEVEAGQGQGRGRFMRENGIGQAVGGRVAQVAAQAQQGPEAAFVLGVAHEEQHFLDAALPAQRKLEDAQQVGFLKLLGRDLLRHAEHGSQLKLLE